MVTAQALIIQVLTIIGIALSPAIIWLAFFLHEDENPEPVMLIIRTFLIGMIVSAPALLLQILVQMVTPNSNSILLGSIFIYAAIEETLKFFGTYALVNGNPDFDEPVDAMIYMIVAGLGFATVENIFIVASLMKSVGNVDFMEVGQMISLRLVGATLLHTLASAIIGYYWAKGIISQNRSHFIIIGISIAVIVHSIFNYLVSQFQDVSILIPTLFLVGVSFFVFSDFEKLKDIVI
ncbi:MAG: PrsW family glutamic-type intramembrane protease [bacterium]|nr:PrsW family glutamic-type intramembrane protease [Candidatus Jorgensenbacteria bacterium]